MTSIPLTFLLKKIALIRQIKRRTAKEKIQGTP
jgi:hypothetical protein